MQIPRDSNAILRTMRGKQNSLMGYPYITIFHYCSSFYFMDRNYKTSGGEAPVDRLAVDSKRCRPGEGRE